ncbi:MAG: S1/P1 Nuclease [Candidatus Manganitrophaceae bacterium]|nr:MAG: S1/P1 Nuclease [Candidatus Manganitrophaceae bacterium]
MSSRCKTRAGLRARRLLTLSFFLCFSLLSPRFLYAWGEAGHRIIADIAEQHLSERAHKEIRSLIGEASLASIADWADRIRGDRPETAHWHFVNIPFQASRYRPKRDCAEGDCLIAAIGRFRAALSDPARPVSERIDALKFLVHFIADLHQPLHATDHVDRGGNDVPVVFFGEEISLFSKKPWNLHAVWDAGLIDRTGLSEQAYVERLQARLKRRSIADLQSGSVIDWALEAHRAAVDVAYRIPKDRKLSKPYFEKSIPTMDGLLAKAGVRLARVLNEAFQTGK